jgi:hypothetical protein
MRLFEAIASAFFKTFGITQPSAENRRRAAWFLLVLLLLGLLAIGSGSILIFHMVHASK